MAESKNVLIVGGGSGIGAACAIALADSAFSVVIAGRTASRLESVAEKGPEQNPIRIHSVDVACRDSVTALIKWVNESLGQIDILINCAGINIPNRATTDLTPEAWDKVQLINSTGAFNLVHAVLPQMRDRKDGLILNVSSVAGVRGSVLGGAAYSASKFAMAGFGLTVGDEERLNGIRVTNIYPGEVETPILDERPEPVSAEHRARILQPEDLASAVVMVCSLPPRARVPEITMIPTSQSFV